MNPRLLGTLVHEVRGSSYWAHRCDGSCAASLLGEMLSLETISYLSRDTGCGGLLEPVSLP